MKKLILGFIFVLVFLMISLNSTSALSEPLIYYKLNLNYSDGNININSIGIEFSQKKIENLPGFYTIKVFGFKSETLETISFDVPRKVLWDKVDPKTGEIVDGGLKELNEVSFELFVPYYKNAEEIIIYGLELKELSRENVSHYSKIVRIAEETSEEEIEKEERVIEDKKEIIEKPFIEKINEYWWAFLIALIILIIILFYLLQKKK